jgi:hypothetical protein
MKKITPQKTPESLKYVFPALTKKEKEKRSPI